MHIIFRFSYPWLFVSRTTFECKSTAFSTNVCMFLVDGITWSSTDKNQLTATSSQKYFKKKRIIEKKTVAHINNIVSVYTGWLAGQGCCARHIFTWLCLYTSCSYFSGIARLKLSRIRIGLAYFRVCGRPSDTACNTIYYFKHLYWARRLAVKVTLRAARPLHTTFTLKRPIPKAALSASPTVGSLVLHGRCTTSGMLPFH